MVESQQQALGLLLVSSAVFLYISFPILLTPFLDDAPQLLRPFPSTASLIKAAACTGTAAACVLLATLGIILCGPQIRRMMPS
mmetsp:Transcript_12685/g.38246  ORF Transcript_12685/g.38246 Transcript_12685/m.38246 type:complete len:83 (-) Transcript_12685:2481-2729(-)